MFKWECPKCGRDLDVSLTECPDCAAAETAAPAAADVQPERTAEAVESSPPAKVQSAPSAFSLTPKHLLSFVFLLGVAVAAAVFLARPDLVPTPELPVSWRDPGPAEQPGRGNNDPLELAGIRLTENGDDEPVVRLVVINHGEQAVKKALMEVMLREFGAPVDAPPEVSFKLELAEELGSGESREMEIPLDATPDSGLPRWGRLRVDVRRLAQPVL